MRTTVVAALRHATMGTVAMLAIAACNGRSDAPLTANDTTRDVVLTIDLVTPNANDGAVLFDIVGPRAVALSTRPELLADQDTTTANSLATSTITIRGDLASGAIGSFTVPRSSADAYSVRLREVAADANGGYASRTDLGTYRLTIRR